MGRYGNFYVGKSGFQYKKAAGGGAHRVFPLGAMGNTPHTVDNSFVPGSGVGASTTSVRRARLLKATKCSPTYPCAKTFSKLGLYSQGGANNYAFNWYLLK